MLKYPNNHTNDYILLVLGKSQFILQLAVSIAKMGSEVPKRNKEKKPKIVLN